jgi:hypothetical protein
MRKFETVVLQVQLSTVMTRSDFNKILKLDEQARSCGGSTLHYILTVLADISKVEYDPHFGPQVQCLCDLSGDSSLAEQIQDYTVKIEKIISDYIS